MGKPCRGCPWLPNSPLGGEITPLIQQALERDEWFCCHENLGTCYGAEIRKRQIGIDSRPINIKEAEMNP
jgi:hypothetical protein